MPESYKTILERMTQSYARYAGFRPSRESDVMLRLRVLAGEIYQERAYAEFVLRQMFPTTATGGYLDRHAQERGISRKPASTAGGDVYFYAAELTHGEILIPAGTQICTYTDHRRYTTDSDVKLPTDAERVAVHVTAVEAGAAYNARGGTVTVIVTPVAGIGRVYNGSPFHGGSDTESDEELRSRVVDSFKNIINSVNAAYYRRLALEVSDVVSASAVGCARGAGTVNVYVLGRGGERVPNRVLTQVQTKLSEARELNVDVLAAHPQQVLVRMAIWLTIEAGYSFSDVSAEVDRAVTSYVDSLGIGGSMLLSDVGEIIYHIKGVKNYHFDESLCSDCYISDAQYLALEQLTIQEGS